MALPVTISGISTSVACVGPYKTTNSPYIVNEGNAGVTFDVGDSSSRQKQAQTFTIGASDVVVDIVRIVLLKSGSPTDNVTCEIWSTSSGSPSTLIATATNVISGSSISGVIFHTFSFSDVSLSASTKYALVVARSGSVDSVNYVSVSGTSTSAYSGGGTFSYNGSVWSSESTTNDWRFAVGGGTAYYFFGRDGTTATTLQVFKATDPTSSWSSVKTKTGIAGTIQVLAGAKNNEVIHLAMIFGATTSVDLGYFAFDMTVDSFTLDESVHASFNPQTSASASVYACSIVFRGSDNEPVIEYNGPRVASMGNSYSQIYYIRRSGGTWTPAGGQQVSAGGQNNFIDPEAILGASNSTHFIHGNLTSSNWTQRTLNSSNSLQTVSGNVANVPSTNGLFQAVSYDSSGTQKIVVALDSANVDIGRFDSGNTPTISTVNAETGGLIPRAFVDTGDSNKVWVLYRLTSDGDLYVENSTDNGATWGSKTSAFVATVVSASTSLSIDGEIYQRDSDFVIPYIVNDNSTLKYNEYVVRSIASDTLFAQAVM